LFKTKKEFHLDNPFPVEKLPDLNFGFADGYKEDWNRRDIIQTSSVKEFLRNRHSIIVGAIGTGKSTLFSILKNSSERFNSYKEDLIIPIEEAPSFLEIDDLFTQHKKQISSRNLYQLIWKFKTLSSISEKISNLPNFPSNTDEAVINNFLKDISNKNQHISTIKKIGELITRYSIDANIGDTSIALSLSDKKSNESRKINLDNVQSAISDVLKNRKIKRATIIIDKIDKFAAGIEYDTQRTYITSLLEVDDDFDKTENINFKIFLREDLFERLDYTGLGYDKVNDRVLKLRLSKE